MKLKRLKTEWVSPYNEIPSIETIYRQATKCLVNGIDAAIKSKLIECGFGELGSTAEYHEFLKEHITMLNFESGELSELWVDYGLESSKLICTMNNEFNVEFNEGSITLTYE